MSLSAQRGAAPPTSPAPDPRWSPLAGRARHSCPVQRWPRSPACLRQAGARRETRLFVELRCAAPAFLLAGLPGLEGCRAGAAALFCALYAAAVLETGLRCW